MMRKVVIGGLLLLQGVAGDDTDPCFSIDGECETETRAYTDALIACNGLSTGAPTPITPFPTPEFDICVSSATPLVSQTEASCLSTGAFLFSGGGPDESQCEDGPQLYLEWLKCSFQCACDVTVCEASDNSAVGVIAGEESLSTFYSLLQEQGLIAILSASTYTVFAPDNDAFAAISSLDLSSDELTQVLYSHIVFGALPSTSIQDNGMVFAFSGSSWVTTLDPVMIDDATVTTADLTSSGGSVVHIIDKVLGVEAPVVEATPTMAPTMTVANGMPTNMAPTMTVANGMPTMAPSMTAANGMPTMPAGDMMPTGEPVGTIVDIAVATDFLSTLVTAVVATNLTDTLNSEGPFTVFAPTNDAFDALPEGTLESLLNDTETLSDILLYHVVSGEFASTDLSDGMVVETVLGSSFTLDLSDGVVIIFETGNSTVTIPDIPASNGIIHVVDTVLIPPVDSCSDSTAWYKRGDPSKDCAWVANHPPRCGVKGWDSTLASYSCPAACGTSCDDSMSWYKNGDPSKDCAWVQTFIPNRCAVRGVDGIPASEACLTSCPSD